MADSVELEVKLDDNASAPSKKVAHAIGKMDKAFGRAGKGAALALGVALVAVGKAAVSIATQFGKATLHGADFARTTRNMFTAFTGSAAKGEAALEDILRIAQKTAAPLEEVRTTYSTLMAAGIKGQLLKDLTTMRFDFAAMGEEAETAFGKFTDAVVEGEVTASQFEDIAKNLGGKDVFGKALGLSDLALQDSEKGVEQLGKELKKLDPLKMLEIAVATHKAKSGMGETAKGAATLQQRLASMKEISFAKIGAKLEDRMGPALDRMEKFLASPEGEKMFDNVAKAIENTCKAIERAGPAMSKFADACERAYKAWKAIDQKLEPIQDPFEAGNLMPKKSQADKLAEVRGKFDAWDDPVGSLFEGATESVTGDLSGVASAVGLTLSTLSASVSAQFSTMVANASTWGSSLVQGFANGITANLSKATDAADKLASSVTGAVTGALQIKSPSKVFAKMGEMTTSGFEGGMAGDAPKLQAATADMFMGSVVGTGEGAADRGGGGGGGGGSPTVNITVNCEPGADGDEIAAKVRREVENVFEGLANSAGV